VDIEKEHSDNGEASYALGCCYVAGGRPSKGLESLVRAAKKSPLLSARVIERVESLGDHPDLPADVRLLKLADLYLGQGDQRRASGLLTTILDRNNAMAGDVADILRSSVESVGENLDTHFIFIEASFAAGRRETALAKLREIHRHREHRARLVEWLESKSNSERLSTEIQLFFAEIALNEGLFGKAIEIFKDMLSHGSEEQAVIKELLSKHQNAPLVRHFYNERFGASSVEESETGGEFERYDDGGFAAAENEPPFSDSSGGAEPDRLDDARKARDAHLDLDEAPFGTGSRSRADVQAPTSDFDNRDFSLSMHAPDGAPVGDKGSENTYLSPGEPDDSDLFEYLKRDFRPGGRAPCKDGLPGDAGLPTDLDLPSADFDVAGQRFDMTGADDTPDESPAETRVETAESVAAPAEPSIEARVETAESVAAPAEPPVEARVETAESVAAPAEPPVEARVETAAEDADRAHASPGESPVRSSADDTEDSLFDQTTGAKDEPAELPEDFDSLYRAFLNGTLDRGRVLDLAGQAFDEGRMIEMKRLLAFEPANLGEDIARKYQLARYYLAMDRPMSALVALKTVQLGALSREERKTFLLRIADCYRKLHNHEAAHGVYLRIMSDHPGDPAVEAVAKTNYSRYVEAAAGAAPALEKLTDL
jgi:tetratricopeptide (TPR) repeat protein